MNAYRMIALALLCLLLTACAGSQGSVPAKQSQTKQKFEQTAALSAADELFLAIKKAIANHYYVNKDIKKTRVYVNEFSSSLDDDGLLKNYIHRHVLQHIETANQLTLGDFLNTGADCILSLNIENLGRRLVKVSVDVKDYRSGKTIAQYSNAYPKDSFYNEDFDKFKTTYINELKKKQLSGNTRLVVALEILSKSSGSRRVKEIGISGSSRGSYSGSYGSGSFDSKSNSNFDAKITSQVKTIKDFIYPTEVVFIINGRPYVPDGEGIVFDNYITPGKHTIKLTFRSATWNGSNATEIKGKRHEKFFSIELKKDRATLFDVALELSGKNARYEVALKDVTVDENNKGSIQKVGYEN